jgi:PTH1 family peptidyl-tRNA hydrolase
MAPSPEHTSFFHLPRLFEREQAPADVYLLVGLGNPGREYAQTRHNIGFRLADHLVTEWNGRFSRQQSNAFVASVNRSGAKIVLAKPQTFMNLSGRSVSGLVNFYKLPLARVLIFCDDIDLPFGTLRLRASGSSGGQRGMQSILEALGSREVPRLRLGIGRPPGRMNPVDYVIHKFEPAEEEALPGILARASQAVEAFLDRGLDRAMTEYNGPAAE